MASITLSNKYLRYGLAVFLGAFICLLSYFRAFELYELQTYDWRCQLRGPRPVSDEIVLIDIWDDTLKELGAWPFDREYHAELIKVLKAYGAKAVAMDLLFVEPRDGDAAVAEAAKEAGNIYFAYAFFDPTPEKGVFQDTRILAPLLDSYRSAGKGTGHVNVKADIDGKRRKVFPIVYHESKPSFQLSLKMAMDVLGLKEKEVVVSPGRHILFSKDLKLPLDDQGYFFVNYAGRWEKTFQHYSYYDVLASYLEMVQGVKPRIEPEKLQGKICFVGLTSLGSHDTSPVPIQSIYPMVGLHANILNSILKKDFISRLDRLWNVLISLAVVLGVLVIVLRFKPVVALGGTVLALFGYAAFVMGCFALWGLWVDLFYPLVLFVISYAAATLGRTVFEIRKRELIENELKIASQIQKSFLPAAVPQERGLEVAVYMKPAKAVGGDLYSFVALGEGLLGVMLGDVSGKGTPAALFMAKAVSEFKFFSRDKNDPAQVLSDLNDSVAGESTGGLFVTVTYVIFDVKRKKAVFSNGGHLPMVLSRQEGGASLLQMDDGMPIGVIQGVPFSNSEISLKQGDCLVLYSDGISEARNRKKEEYGVEALQSSIQENRGLSAQEIIDRSILSLGQFAGRADQHDDMTLIVVKVGSLNGQ